MRNRTAFVTLLAAIGIVLAGCTTAPEPALSSSSGPKLDPEAIAYDNLDFNISRDRIFESCRSLPAEFASEAELESKPEDGYGGCNFEEQWGSLTIRQPAQQEREDAKVFFKSYWLGDKSSQEGSFQRGILLERYYSITQVNSARGTCDVAVDTGSETALVVIAEPPYEESNQTFDSGGNYPVATVHEQYCSRAKQAAEKLLLLLDPQGGSRKIS